MGSSVVPTLLLRNSKEGIEGSLPAGKSRQPTAQVLIATDICFKSTEPPQIPSELALLINYDLPIRKVSLATSISRI